MMEMFASLWLEGGVVSVVCVIFLILFVVAGVKGIIEDKELRK